MADNRLAQLMKHDDSSRKQGEDSMAEAVRQHPLVDMQKAVGNTAVARMIAMRQAEEEEMQAKHDPALQRQEEEEAMQAKHDPALQRQEEEEEMQAKHDDGAPVVGLEGGEVGEEISSSISALSIGATSKGSISWGVTQVALATGAGTSSTRGWPRSLRSLPLARALVTASLAASTTARSLSAWMAAKPQPPSATTRIPSP